MAPRDNNGASISPPARRTPRMWLGTLGPWTGLALAALLISCLIAPGAVAQPRGGLLGLVVDTEGLELAEVEIKLEGSDRSFETTTDERGRFSFGRLRPGSYRLTVKGDGFSKAHKAPLTVRAGRPTSVRVELAETVDDVLIVATEPAITRPEPTPQTMLGGDVERITANRDPFSSLARVPGVQVVGSGADEAVVSPGSGTGESIFYVDGLEGDATPAVLPSSSRLQWIDSSADALSSASGTIINLTTPDGGPKRRADVELSHADGSWLDESRFDEITLGTGGLGSDALSPGRIDTITSLGLDAGGSLFDDRLWLWGAFNRRELDGQAFGGGRQSSDLEHGAVRLSGALGRSNSLSLSAHRTERRHDGVGAGADRGDGATQTDYSPSTWLKLEDSHQFGADWLLTLHLGLTEDALSLEPLGDGDITLNANGVWQGSWRERREQVDASTVHADLSWSHRAGRADHELRFGFNHRASESAYLETWGEQNVLVLAGENYGTPYDLVRLFRPADLQLERDTDAFWLQDRVTFSGATDWTFDLGLRLENQSGEALAGASAAHPLFPDLLPGAEQTVTEPVAFDDLLPRFSAAWTPGGSWSPTVRFGWSRFAGRLRDDLLERISPLAGAELMLGFDDLDENQRFDSGEPFRIVERQGFDAFDASAAGEAPAPGLRSELTDEWRFGLEARPAPAIELRLDVVRREISRVFDSRRLVRTADGTVRLATVSDYRFDALYSGFLPDGAAYSVPVYSLIDGLELTGASLIENGQRRQIYDAVTFSVTRRLSRGFMLRAHATWSDWSWQIPGTYGAFDDPTNTALGDLDGVDDNGAVVTGRGAEDRWVNSRWSFDVLALLQVAPNSPWGFDVSAHVHGREGYPIPYSLSVISNDRLREVQATPEVDTYRLEDVITLDLRLEKTLPLGASDMTLALDILNVLDEGNVLERESRLSSPLAGQARATVSPRVVQLGVRWAWH